jgi:hypothetical protein
MSSLFSSNPVYFVMAIAGTLLFLLKLAFMFIGGGADIDGEFDGDLEGDVSGGDTFSLVSVQSILAFFMGAGWIGLAATLEWRLGQMQSVLAASFFGFLMMLLSSFLTMKIKSLNTVQKFDIKKAVGISGRAYTKIPEKGAGIGQVEITLQGKQQIMQAMSTGNAIESFAAVKVVKVDDSGNLIVENT